MICRSRIFALLFLGIVLATSSSARTSSASGKTTAKKDAKVTFFAYYNSDLVEGRQLQLTNKDGSRTFLAIHMHENRLYIIDGTVPKGAPQPALFQQSMGFIDKEGKRIRYQEIYSNAYPPPKRLVR